MSIELEVSDKRTRLAGFIIGGRMKKHNRLREEVLSPNGVATDPVTTRLATSNEIANQDEIEKLAYTFWVAPGCPTGSPNEDWFRAEQEIQERQPTPA